MRSNERGPGQSARQADGAGVELLAHGVAHAEDINVLASLAHLVDGIHIVPAGELVGVLAPSACAGETAAVAFFERVRMIAARVTLIPSRFGEPMTCDAMREALHVRRAGLGVRLGRLRGLTEMCVRFDRASLDEAIGAVQTRSKGAEPPAMESAGAAFLRARRQELDKREGISPQQRAWIAATVGPLAKRCKDVCIRGSTVTGPAAHLLVEKTECERIADDAARVLHIVGVRASVSGPWPMYNFIDDE